jgi:hypothetical protein
VGGSTSGVLGPTGDAGVLPGDSRNGLLGESRTGRTALVLPFSTRRGGVTGADGRVGGGERSVAAAAARDAEAVSDGSRFCGRPRGLGAALGAGLSSLERVGPQNSSSSGSAERVGLGGVGLEGAATGSLGPSSRRRFFFCWRG